MAAGNRKNAKNKERARVYAASLSDLTTREVEVEVSMPGDDSPIIVIPMKALSYADYMQPERDYPAPIPQVVGGLNGQTVLDKDPEYLRQVRERNEKVMYARIVRSLSLPFQSIDEAGKIEELRHMTSIIVNALINAVWQIHMTGEARVIARAESFQPQGRISTPDIAPVPSDTNGVEQPA